MTQALLAKQVQVSQQFISQLLRGERRPKWETAKQLAQLTKTSPQLWMEGNTAEIPVLALLKVPESFHPSLHLMLIFNNVTFQ